MRVIPDPIGPGQESVWSYPRPAVAEPSQCRLKIVHRDVIVAETLKGAKIMVEAWRRHYNTVRPHSSLRYRPPAPEAICRPPDQFASGALAQTPSLN